ncbi:MAG: glycosyltransferase family 2 protein [Acidobacteria bacterium]|nr:glycosyltransferase family 2 protein [Acidobacteriota bacterium]
MFDSEKLSVIILIHNNVDLSRRCLQALADAAAGLDHEVILLDNNSTEDTGCLRDFAHVFRGFKWIRNAQNSSFSIGNNRCAREASGRRLLFLNNDVFLQRESLEHLIAPLREDRGTGVAGGKLLFPGEESVQHAGIGQMLWDHPSNYGVGANPSDARIREKCERFALSGAMLCVDRGVFEKVGGFDERYVWGTEDIDLCLKIRAAGFRVIYCPDAVAVHCESATLKVHKSNDAEGNCRLYRRLWDPLLIPAEQGYVRSLKEQGIRRVAVFGMGTAARGLARILDENDIRIAAFTSSGTRKAGDSFLGRPVIPPEQLEAEKYDRLMVATQYFFEIEPKIRRYDPHQEPIYPLLN